MQNSIYTYLDPAELARIADLELLARTVISGLQGGAHRSIHHGASVEFAQYRPYAWGDDLRFVDWRLYGRSDRLHVKQFQDERNLRSTILLDCSASMDYGSGEVSKFRYAQMLAACLVMLASGQGDAVGFAAYHRELIAHVPARRRDGQRHRILMEIDNLRPAGEETDTAGTLRVMGDVLPARGMVVLIGDLLHPADEMILHLRSLRAQRHDVLVLQVSDPAEQTFPFDRSVTLVDAEDSREQFAVPEEVREAYLENRRRHFSAIREACLSAEIDIEEFACSEPLDMALHRFLHRRNDGLIAPSRRSRGGV